MFASTHSRLVNGLVLGPVTDIEDHDGTVVATGGNKCGTSGMEINAHDSTFGGERKLGPVRILDRETTNEARSLTLEFVGTVRDGKHVRVARIPANCCDSLLARLVRSEAPQRKHRTERVTFGIHRVVLVVLVVVEEWILSILDDHALHNLETAAHVCGVERIIVVHLDHLLRFLILLPQLGRLFRLLSQGVFVFLHEGVKDHPLSRLLLESRRLGWVGLDAALAEHNDWRLRSALLIIEHVSQRLLQLVLTVVRNLSVELLTDFLIDGFK